MNMQDKKISQRLQDKVNRELVRGEHITWIDKPVPQFFYNALNQLFCVRYSMDCFFCIIYASQDEL